MPSEPSYVISSICFSLFNELFVSNSEIIQKSFENVTNSGQKKTSTQIKEIERKQKKTHRTKTEQNKTKKKKKSNSLYLCARFIYGLVFFFLDFNRFLWFVCWFFLYLSDPRLTRLNRHECTFLLTFKLHKFMNYKRSL